MKGRIGWLKVLLLLRLLLLVKRVVVTKQKRSKLVVNVDSVLTRRELLLSKVDRRRSKVDRVRFKVRRMNIVDDKGSQILWVKKVVLLRRLSEFYEIVENRIGRIVWINGKKGVHIEKQMLM